MAANGIKPFAPKPPNMTPIDPVTPEDVRPAIRDLLAEHADQILKIREGIETNPLYDPKLHDDLWMLRFWLSHKDSSSKPAKALKSAIDAAAETMEFRKKYKLDDADVRRSLWPEWDGPDGQIHPKEFRRFLSYVEKYGVMHTQLHPDRGLVSFIRLASMDNETKLAETTEEEELMATILYSEWRFQVLDEVTRRTGRLTKHAMFIDLGGVGLKHMNRKNSERDSKFSKITENVYPQANGGFFLLNLSKVITVFLRLVRPLYPKRFMEKMDVIITESDVNRIYPRFAEVSTIPERFRGTHPSWPPPETGIKFVEENYQSVTG